MIVGYNGVDFCGSQKNRGVRTVEEEIEKAFYQNGLIAKHNFGDLAKVAWSRATRTDKRVHALENCFSCKIQFSDQGKDYQDSYEPLRKQINATLPSDVKIFALNPVANRFDAKLATSHREYSYFLPTYMLVPINELLLESPPKPITEDEDNVRVETAVTKGIKKILRKATEADEVEDAEKFLERDMSHISAEMVAKMYATRLSDETKAKLESYWKSYAGTRNYHNYTKDVKCHQMAANRFMIQMEANEYRYVNKTTMKVTEASDPDGIEFVRFYLKG